MKTDAELRALAALAEAASFGGEFQQWTVVDGESTMDWRKTPSAESAYPNNRAFVQAASPDVVRELVARALKAEAIVRDLAKADVYDQYGTCQLCFEQGYEHAADCLRRRAVDLKF